MLPYIRTIWADYMAPALKALNLNKIESKLEENTAETISNTSKLGAQQNQINAIVTESTDNSEVIAARTSIIKAETFASLGARLEDSESDTGDLINLDTDAKTSVVNSINEVYAESLTPKQTGGGYLINGDFQVWQRGTSFISPSSVYTADRFKCFAFLDSNADINRVLANAGLNQKYELQINETNGSSSGSTLLDQSIENIDIFKGKKATVSVTFKMPAGISGGLWIIDNEGNNNVALAGNGNYQTIELNRDISDNITSLLVRVDVSRVGASIGEVLRISRIKLELGDIATDFIHKNYAEELISCQRYFEKSYNTGVSPGTISIDGSVQELLTRNIADYTQGARYKVEKLLSPTITIYSPSTGTPNKIDNAGDKSVVGVSYGGTSGFGLIQFTSGSIASNATYHWVADAEL